MLYNIIVRLGGKKAIAEHAAVWVPDAEAAVCMHCKKNQFTVLNRRVSSQYSFLQSEFFGIFFASHLFFFVYLFSITVVNVELSFAGLVQTNDTFCLISLPNRYVFASIVTMNCLARKLSRWIILTAIKRVRIIIWCRKESVLLGLLRGNCIDFIVFSSFYVILFRISGQIVPPADSSGEEDSDDDDENNRSGQSFSETPLEQVRFFFQVSFYFAFACSFQ